MRESLKDVALRGEVILVASSKVNSFILDAMIASTCMDEDRTHIRAFGLSRSRRHGKRE